MDYVFTSFHIRSLLTLVLVSTVSSLMIASHPKDASSDGSDEYFGGRIAPQPTIRKGHDQLKQSGRSSTFSTRMMRGCPPMPNTTAEWENSYLWAVFFDGKDAKKGPHIYDWDRKFFYRVSKLLTKIYAEEHTEQGQEELTVKLVEKYRKQTYEDVQYNEVCSEGHCVNKAGGNEIMPQCTNEMSCNDVEALLQNIPHYLYTHDKKKTTNPVCPKGLRAEIPQSSTKRKTLAKLINAYNSLLHATIDNPNADKHDVLDKVVQFARSFAFLHPFENGNGRLRNMLLQRELRRLGIACGTMMYNYNKDAFVDGHERYLAKVQEGIMMFELARDIKTNPWLDEQRVADHEKQFETLNGLEKCAARKRMGSGGTINFDRAGSAHDTVSNETKQLSLEDFA